MSEVPIAHKDSKLAFELLNEYLMNNEDVGSQCEINVVDPPDLIVTWRSGERWGVEVTRSYPPARRIGDWAAASSEDVGKPLWQFAKGLTERTKKPHQRSYTLYLEGPGPFNSWRHSSPAQSSSFEQWKRETETLIVAHVKSGSSGVLKFCGGLLKPGKSGTGWNIMVCPSPAAELTSTAVVMFRRVLESKAKGLSRWTGDFNERWLLVLSCHPLIDVRNVGSILPELVHANETIAGFDGLYFNEIQDRKLFPIRLRMGGTNKTKSSELPGIRNQP